LLLLLLLHVLLNVQRLQGHPLYNLQLLTLLRHLTFVLVLLLLLSLLL
jgi:hypothetical protein